MSATLSKPRKSGRSKSRRTSRKARASHSELQPLLPWREPIDKAPTTAPSAPNRPSVREVRLLGSVQPPETKDGNAGPDAQNTTLERAARTYRIAAVDGPSGLDLRCHVHVTVDEPDPNGLADSVVTDGVA